MGDDVADWLCGCGCGGRPITRGARFVHGHNTKKPIEVRFWAKVQKRGRDECWNWTRNAGSHGYGQLHGAVSAHRYAYELLVGPIPDGLHLDHLCRNRLCVNPAHLEPVTPAENVARSTPATKTHCVHGHEYTPETTRRQPRPDGTTYRRCLVCNRERLRALRARRAA